jgi:hypothetical protein
LKVCNRCRNNKNSNVAARLRILACDTLLTSAIAEIKSYHEISRTKGDQEPNAEYLVAVLDKLGTYYCLDESNEKIIFYPGLLEKILAQQDLQFIVEMYNASYFMVERMDGTMGGTGNPKTADFLIKFRRAVRTAYRNAISKYALTESSDYLDWFLSKIRQTLQNLPLYAMTDIGINLDQEADCQALIEIRDTGKISNETFKRIQKVGLFSERNNEW